MIKFLKEILLSFLVGRKYALPELKLVFSEVMNHMTNEINTSEIAEKDIDDVITILSQPDLVTPEVIFSWTEKVINSSISISLEKRKNLLYSLRWGIARLSQEDYEDLQGFIEYGDAVCSDLINEKVRSAVCKAEKVVANKRYEELLYKGFVYNQLNNNDEFAN
jgi:hypothetical protein